MYPLLTSASKELHWAATNKHLSRCSQMGLRTLVCGYKEVPMTEFIEWMEAHKKARASTDNREEQVGASYERLEQNLTLCGVTAIEDRLQDGVPHAVATLMKANIKAP